MAGNLMTEEEFEILIRGSDLSREEREALRKKLNLPCDENFLHLFVFPDWQAIAVTAHQKTCGRRVLCY